MELEQLATFDWMVRGAVVALAFLAGGFIARRGRGVARLAAPLFLLSLAAYALNSGPYASDLLGPFKLITSILTHGCVGFFWLFALIHFEDRPLTPGLLVVPVSLLLVGAIGDLTVLGQEQALWIAFNAVCMTLTIAVLVQVARSWAYDLVEARRRLRTAFVTAFGVFAVLVLVFEFAFDPGEEPSLRSFLFACALLGIAALSVLTLLKLDANVLAAPPRPAAVAPRDDQAIERLMAAMEVRQAWREEGLTISALAAQVKLSEPALRALINERLGYRNFPAFVNAMRIEAAKTALVDPDRSHLTAAAIAFDLGFGSLAPFNRAFREQTGITPTEWRRRTAGEA